MAVVEYLLHRNHEGKIVPPFIMAGGHWWNPVDKTMVGWVEDDRDYYIPDTIVYLTRESFAQRALTMHATNPFRKKNSEDQDGMGMLGENSTIMTEAEVTELANIWYDNFVQEHSGNSGS